MAQIGDMANLEARLTTLGSQAEQLAQILQRVPEVSSETSALYDWQDELNDFTADIKQTRTQLSSFRQRFYDATVVKSEDVTRLEKREEEIEMKEELLEQKAAEMTKRGELLDQMAAEMTKRGELLDQETRAINEREGIIRRREETFEPMFESFDFQTEIKRSESENNEERTSSRQTIQQLQHFLFSKLLSIQNDQTISLPAAFGNRLLFKGQQLSISQDTLAQWIQGPLKETLDTLTNSTDTLNLAETYQLVLGSLTCLQSSNIQDKESLLECMRNFQTWLTKACKDRTSILGLALAHAIKVIQEGPQSDPWFSTNQFDAWRTIDSRNSELPQTTSIIADGCPGIVLVVQGTSIQVCEATDIFMRQQTSFGIQLIFNEALKSPDLQLLADSWPHMDRWEPLIVWAVNVGRFNFLKGTW